MFNRGLLPFSLVVVLLVSGCLFSGSNVYAPSRVALNPQSFMNKTIMVRGNVNLDAIGGASGAMSGTQMLSDRPVVNLLDHDDLKSRSLYILHKNGTQVSCYQPPFSNRPLECDSPLKIDDKYVDGVLQDKKAVIKGKIIKVKNGATGITVIEILQKN